MTDERRAGPEAAPGREDELARLQVRLSEAEFERELAREGIRRLEEEKRRLEQRLAQCTADQASLRSRLEDASDRLSAIHGSAAWRALEAARGLVGRRWSR